MKKVNCKLIFVIFVAFIFGCAKSVPFKSSDINSSDPIEVVVHETPRINIATLGGLVLQSLGGLLTAPVGIAINENAAKKVKDGVVLLDFGWLVMNQFSERIRSNKLKWPQMKIRDQTVNKDYKSEYGNKLEFRVDKWGVAGRYFYSLTIVTMKNSNGKVTWQKAFSYHSSTYKRGNKLEAFLADNGKLLKEEIAHAADLTVSDFIKHLEGE